MTEMKFSEDDKKQLIEFLNMVAQHAKLTLDTKELIRYFQLLNHMQTKILPKMDANILEVKRVIQAAQKQPESESKAEIQNEVKKGKK